MQVVSADIPFVTGHIANWNLEGEDIQQAMLWTSSTFFRPVYNRLFAVPDTTSCNLCVANFSRSSLKSV